MSDPIQHYGQGTYIAVLGALSQWLDKGAEHAAANGISPEGLMEARLAPDMYPLSRQVHAACDQARDAMLILAGKAAPHVEDDSATIGALKARIDATIGFVKVAQGLDGAAERALVLPLNDSADFHFTGEQWLRDWGLANFYFHVVTAYGILRHLGVPVGKYDYMSFVGPYIRPK